MSAAACRLVMPEDRLRSSLPRPEENSCDAQGVHRNRPLRNPPSQSLPRNAGIAPQPEQEPAGSLGRAGRAMVIQTISSVPLPCRFRAYLCGNHSRTRRQCHDCQECPHRLLLAWRKNGSNVSRIGFLSLRGNAINSNSKITRYVSMKAKKLNGGGTKPGGKGGAGSCIARLLLAGRAALAPWERVATQLRSTVGLAYTDPSARGAFVSKPR